MYTLQRRKVKDKLDAIGKQLQGEFQSAGLELVAHLSDDHPSLWNKKKVDTQWLFFSRDTNAKKELSSIIDTEKTLAATLEDPTPLYRHIFIGVSVHENSLEIGIRLHHDAWVDRKNLLSLLGDASQRDNFIQLCKSLPSQMCFGVDQTNLTPVNDIDETSLAAFRNEFDTNKGWLFFGTKIDKEAVIEQGSEILTSINQTVREVIKAYQFIAWSPQNDALSMDSIVEQKKQERQATHEELLFAQKEREEKQRQIVEQRQKDKEEKKQELLDEQAWREQERAKRRAAARARREREAGGFDTGEKQQPIPQKDKPSVAPSTPVNRNATTANGADATSRDRANNGKPRSQAPPQPKRRQERTSSQRNRPESKPKGTFRSQRSRNSGAPPKASKLPQVSDKRKAAIQVGDRIIVVDGLLKDRNGIVQNIDEKGDLKVSFGMLSSRVAIKDVKGMGPAV